MASEEDVTDTKTTKSPTKLWQADTEMEVMSIKDKQPKSKEDMEGRKTGRIIKNIWEDIRIGPKEMDRIAASNEPYFKLWVAEAPDISEPVLAYVDTSEQEMLYDPLTYTGDYTTNTSIVTVFIPVRGPPDVFTISSVVLPKNHLIPTNTAGFTSGGDFIYRTSYMMGVSVKFTRLYDEDLGRYAFYTEITNDSDKRAYLLPVINNKQTGKRRQTIRAVQTVDQSDDGKYVFECSDSAYPGLNVKTNN